MATNWREALEELPMPPWARRHYGERLVGMPALIQDIAFEGIAEAAFAPWLKEPTSPNDILDHIGIERMMERFPGEADYDYRERLYDAWTAWLQAGNEASIISQLEGFGLSNIEIKTARDWDWDSLAGLTWAEGVGGEDNWSRFWIVVKGHPWVSEGTVGDGAVVGDGGTVGSNATPEETGAIRRLVKQWKPAHVQCPYVILVMNETTWNAEQPDGTWYDWRNRSRAARYIRIDQRPVLLP